VMSRYSLNLSPSADPDRTAIILLVNRGKRADAIASSIIIHIVNSGANG
jgi:hypothetical protein